jgi:hypothetical protein
VRERARQLEGRLVASSVSAPGDTQYALRVCNLETSPVLSLQPLQSRLAC